MAKHRGKKALYEVISKSRLKSSYDKTLQSLHPEESTKDETPKTKPGPVISNRAKRIWHGPKPIQYNNGRFEISLPYQLAIALLLGLILLVLVAFRLGQISQRASNSTTKMGTSESESAGRRVPANSATADLSLPPEPARETTPATKQIQPAESDGDHVIVLVQYRRRPDLEPVKQHFADFGIPTEIVRQAGWYFLITKSRYDNPESPGTDGYNAKQKIIEVGAKYKGRAPEGYETFAPNFFKDAYGMRIKE